VQYTCRVCKQKISISEEVDHRIEIELTAKVDCIGTFLKHTLAEVALLCNTRHKYLGVQLITQTCSGFAEVLDGPIMGRAPRARVNNNPWTSTRNSALMIRAWGNTFDRWGGSSEGM
jgi:hypothetical protein